MATKKEPVAICTAHYACENEHVFEVFCDGIPPHKIECPACGRGAPRKLFHLDRNFPKPSPVPGGVYYWNGKELVRTPEEVKKNADE